MWASGAWATASWGAGSWWEQATDPGTPSVPVGGIIRPRKRRRDTDDDALVLIL